MRSLPTLGLVLVALTAAPASAITIHVDWSADTNGAFGPGMLSGTLGSFVIDESLLPQTFLLPVGLSVTSSGFAEEPNASGNAFPNLTTPFVHNFLLSIRFDSPTSASLVTARPGPPPVVAGMNTTEFPCVVRFSVVGCFMELRTDRFAPTEFGGVGRALHDEGFGLETFNEAAVTLTLAVVPEPSIVPLLALALAILALKRRV